MKHNPKLCDNLRCPDCLEADVARLSTNWRDVSVALVNMDRLVSEANAAAETAEARVARVEKTLHAWKTGPWASNPVFRDFWGALNAALDADA